MTSIDTTDLAPNIPPRRTWRRRLTVGVAAVALAAGVTGIAAATAYHHAGWGHGARLEFVQRIALHELDAVGATTAQEAKIHDLIATTFASMQPKDGQRDALRNQVLDLMRAPLIDRGAIEKVRVEQVAKFDTMSKTIVAAAIDAAETLTPDQRIKLTENVEAMAKHGPMDGRPPFMDHEPDDAPHGGKAPD
ncbi:Spy/CpxP family protein refolding chaperone [Beijerinckia sp. L45]|uniref:Spy/CpxP family protein refolding chaperone n=1 Tax=Beijerinckia sp. L45 TaxID=1641855 RepID=UPI00131E1072|nr:periplasmic heavy metal sensor [Beijerinckia sp. L45]